MRMTEEDIKKTWRELKIPFFLGVVVFIASVLVLNLGSQKPNPQLMSLLGCVFGIVFMFVPLLKMRKFKKYLKERDQESS